MLCSDSFRGQKSPEIKSFPDHDDGRQPFVEVHCPKEVAEQAEAKSLARFHRNPEHNESFFLNGEAH